MAANFRIFSHRNSDNLHLKLTGDFDGSSAFELINTVKRSQDQVRKIFIHTSNLSSIKPFGLDVFQKNCTIDKLCHTLIFTGDHGRKLAPEGSALL
jgi:hypothetical protein